MKNFIMLLTFTIMSALAATADNGKTWEWNWEMTLTKID